jgi:hypothetical protein
VYALYPCLKQDPFLSSGVEALGASWEEEGDLLAFSVALYLPQKKTGYRWLINEISLFTGGV